MGGGSCDPFTYNTIEVPTVVGLLRNILTQYPDNGQIIKELVQNAEDAGASKVAVLHFPNHVKCPQADPVVRRFLEGPALCLYNDAVFTEEDWHGIRKLSDSIKKNNPLQVGQFGLGFKSVFHITDYVSIISGQQMLFMDPSEPEDKMCRSIPLSKLDEVLPAATCLEVFGQYLTQHHLSSGNFPATIFWFPLRQSSSKISDTVYSPDHVQRLFESFGVEASVCLTFLKALEEVTVGVAAQKKITVSHSMKMSSCDPQKMRQEREAFRQQLQQCNGSPASVLTCSYQATLQTKVGNAKANEYTMTILHYLPGRNDPEWMKWGGRDNSKHVPLVGVAVPTSMSPPTEGKGHIFSFLPLPPDRSNQTCLPIQVNGAFILNQNRRQVKWRSSESSQEPDVVWNEELATKVVTKAYTKLLEELLQKTRDGTIDPTTWYTFLPDLTKTVGRWLQVASEVWRDLLPKPIISSEVQGFLKVQDVLTTNGLNTLNSKMAASVRSVLLASSMPLAALPDHVLASMSVLGHQVCPVTPQHLRNALRACGNLKGKWSLPHLLQYATKDKNYQDLYGLPLLPLQNHTWTSFMRTGVAVYLCSPQQVKALVGLEGQMGSVQVTSAMQILKDVAKTGRMQLCEFHPGQHGPTLLQQSAAHMQRIQPSQQQVVEWLTRVWEVLQKLTLTSVQHIPLLPTSQPPNASLLTSLTQPIVQSGSCSLSKEQVGVLGVLGVVVVPPLPSYIRHIELQGFLYSSDRYGVTKALTKVVSQASQCMVRVNSFNAQRTEEQRKALSTLIDPHNLQPDLRNFLRKLKMFKAQDTCNSICDVCLEGVNVIAPELPRFPVSYPESLLVVSQPQDLILAQALGATQLSREEVCVRALRKCYGDQDISSLVKYILRDAQLVGSNTVLHELKNTRFVPSIGGSLCRPHELYDPEDCDCDALIGETQMPDGSVKQHYSLLRRLGLKKVQEMSQSDLIHLIKRQHSTLLSDTNRTKKSVGLLRAINRRNDCHQVCQAVRDVPFVCGISSRPDQYPTSLEWATPPGLLRPRDLKSSQFMNVIGSAVAVVQCNTVPGVAVAFGWTNTPQVDHVIQHLRNITTAYEVPEWSRYFDLLKKTYCLLANLLDAGTAQLATLKSECCIFTEQGFETPDQVYVWPGEEDLQLQPYLHLLPLGLRESERLFVYLGCAARQSPSLLLRVLEDIQRHHQAGTGGEVERDLRVVVSVLNKLQHHTSELPGALLVPVTTQDDSLEMAEVGQTAYSEAATEWIDSDELCVKVVHPCVSTRLAIALGVAPLQNFLSSGGEAVIEWGQREPLTTRLHNLLRQYRDGVAVLKELVQNADDAGASSVSLLYDQRHNGESHTLLLSPGMAECQGPALWVYNDALFSETDFSNLRDIGSGSKELQLTKIGKFGLGFSSVYNVTDVPSFVSGSNYVVFDPHMTHLNHSTNSPGVRFNFAKRENSYMLRKLLGQFQPFNGVFGCNLKERSFFDGTLFRLPFRTPGQATTSKISDISYSHTDVVQLLSMFSSVVGQLLLFTQHVSSISVFHLHGSATQPSDMVQLFSASRSKAHPVSYPGVVPRVTDETQSLLERTAALFSQHQKLKWNGGMLEERITLEVSVEYSKYGAKLCGYKKGKWKTKWLTSCHSGTGRLCRLAEAHGGTALPLSMVTVPVTKGEDGWQPQALADLPPGFYHEGYFHCFLPLPVKTSLPVQVNGVLEVASDRTNLLTHTEDDRKALSWNATLLEDATVHAYLGLAEALRHLGLSAQSQFYAVWPVKGSGGGTLVETLTKGFYRALEQEEVEMFRCSGGDWHPLSRCLLLGDDLQWNQTEETAFEFLETYLHSFTPQRLIRLPRQVQEGFDRQVLSQHIITREVFFRNYFVPHLSEGIISAEKRDQLTLHLLESGSPDVELLRPLACIPTQPHGNLKPPSHLINPKSRIAKLFSVEDERFPQEHFMKSSTTRSALTKLGMNTRTLPVEVVVERAHSVADLARACPPCATFRVMELLHYIQTPGTDELASKLSTIPFLPVMAKPKNWNVAWHGESSQEGRCQGCPSHREDTTDDSLKASLMLDCPSAICMPDFKSLVGSSLLILGECVKAPVDILQKLGVIVCHFDLPVRSVVEQLCVFSSVPPRRDITSMCFVIYDYLEDLITHVKREKITDTGLLDVIRKLREKKILLSSHGFKEAKIFALYSETVCAPDLFSARTEGLEKYQCLMEILGVNKDFDYDVVMKMIQKRRETHGDQRLNEAEVCQVSKLLNVLFKVKSSDYSVPVLHLPDSQGFLHPATDLCIEDGVNLSSGQFLCLHHSISLSQDMKEWLGIQSKTRKWLEGSSFRLQFGQKEPLTTRLRNILNDYPCDSGIMKELLQNADDARATEVTFYKDYRQLPTEKLFDPKWAPLQGPSLIVFNNRGFTKQDLQSIQDLGNSSKREDPATTGQYGIGFNAVYHLTDAPSFLTRGPQVPQGETLCMFDPHCRYDPFAMPEAPGVQLVNLNDLRNDHPHSFIGYLEEEFSLSEEGTMFRLPLRTIRDSLISKEVLKESDIDEMVQEFEREMPQCLLFLRNVRKISIKKVQKDGKCHEEYCVRATRVGSEECQVPMTIRKHFDSQEEVDPCSIDMVRTCHRMEIMDTKNNSSRWIVVQQLGTDEKNSLPEIVKEAFHLKTLNVLPHGGVAILLLMNSASHTATLDHILSTSCYLPLPTKSGLPFSINGHFTLGSSRRDLWAGQGDAKGMWNAWLLKEVLVPAAAHAVHQYKIMLFPDEDEFYMNEQIYTKRVGMFHNVLPQAQNVSSLNWRNFVRWFYEHVRKEELEFFDSFIPDTDLLPKPSAHLTAYERNNLPRDVLRNGCLRWHAFHGSGDEYPVCFNITIKEQAEKSHQDIIADVLRRLGMKVSSEGMFYRLKAADAEFKCPLLTPNAALEFIKSWDTDINDRCIPRVGQKVADTPFLKIFNVLNVLSYIMRAKDFFGPCVDKLPLLVTNDDVLGCFSIHTPVFLSSFCGLLTNLGKEFVSSSFVTVIESNKVKFKDVVRKFTLADLGERLPQVLDASYCAPDARIPMQWKGWIKRLWNFVESIEEKKNWPQKKENILGTLGNWALYPIKSGGTEYLIPIKNAWQVLHAYGLDAESVFRQLPVPFPSSVWYRVSMLSISQVTCEKPYIPHELQLAAMVSDPAAVLDLLSFHKESVGSFFSQRYQRSKVESREILEYFGTHSEKLKLSVKKIRSLQIFKDPSGQYCNLLGKTLVVVAQSHLELEHLRNICAELSLHIIPKPESPKLTSLYSYIEPNSLVGELDLYTRIILPNISSLLGDQKTFYLEHLSKNLSEALEKNLSEEEQKVVNALKKCHFIEVDGTLKTGGEFYDPTNSVFSVMGVANLPQEWRDRKWHHLLVLAGMVHEVTPEKFMEFVSSLSVRDADVQKKSEVLCKYLSDDHENLKSRMCEILDTQFLVPENRDELEALLPHHQTDSGLIQFSKSTHPKFAKIIWSARSLLPTYATEVAKKLQKHYSNNINIKPPADCVHEHIVKFCTSTKETPEKSKVVSEVIESIYDYLSKSGRGDLQALKKSDVPLVHIPQHKVFVSVSRVIESLEEDILPYLYKAPVVYGKYFSVLKELGMPDNASANSYAQVLRMIHDSSKDSNLHPQEIDRMKKALEGLTKLPYKLKGLSIDELYLPTRNETLRSSSEMFVADNMEVMLAIEKTFQEPVFVGFKALEIWIDDCHFVNMLPERLRPKFISEACREHMQMQEIQEQHSELLDEIIELLQSESFKTGILRTINHYKLQEGSSITDQDKEEIVELLAKVRVRQVNNIVTNLTLHDRVVCQREKKTFLQVDGEGQQMTLTLYLSKKVPPRLIASSLYNLYKRLLQKWDIDRMIEFSIICACYGKPHEVFKCLDESNIKQYSAETLSVSLYKCNVGSYLKEKYLPLLDNEFSELHEKEIVCMRKYLCSNGDADGYVEEEDIFVIVEVVRLVEKDSTFPMLNKYEVNTCKSKPCLITVKAFQLYRFERKSQASATQGAMSKVKDSTQQGAKNEEDIFGKSKKEILREIRKQLQEIWRVEDERERRHLLRRLLFKWHPDKNPNHVELCTSVVQHIQSLVGLLERGEPFPDDEDLSDIPQETPSASYDWCFNPPPRQYRRNTSDHDQARIPRPDLPEARRWNDQASCDLAAAERMVGESPSWAVFMCYQAAEKALMAALYAQDRDQASNEERKGPLERTLSSLAVKLAEARVQQWATSIQDKAGGFLGPLYPRFDGCPRDLYTERDAQQVLSLSRKILNVVNRRVN